MNHQTGYTAAAAAEAAPGCSSSGGSCSMLRLPPLPADVTHCGLWQMQPGNQK